MATSTSDELLNVGKKFHDPLLVTREKPTRLPPSAALCRAKSFLPQLQKANQDLEALISSGQNDELDIEKIDEDGQFIEMNVMLFNEDDSDEDEDAKAAEHQMSSSSDSDTDVLIGEVTEDNIKLPNQGQRKKPVILEMTPDTKHCPGGEKPPDGDSRTSVKSNLSSLPKKSATRRGKRQKNMKSNKKKRKGQKN